MELIYNVALEVEINSRESTLLHKYISLHPEHKRHINSGHFAENFSVNAASEEHHFILTKEVLDIFVAVLEDQEFDDPEENIHKERLIYKFYSWSKIIYNEEDQIEDFRIEYDCFKLNNIIPQDDYFNLKQYIKVKIGKLDYLPEPAPEDQSVFAKILKCFSWRRIK